VQALFNSALTRVALPMPVLLLPPLVQVPRECRFSCKIVERLTFSVLTRFVRTQAGLTSAGIDLAC
jgi:hypothetical protein